ncbi:MAG: hypothetical protein ACI837_001102 [Crocinitomicaceae bacterium]|jgi:hypothetical protein
MKKSLLIGFIGLTVTVNAQSVSRDVISSSGSHFENATMQMSWTLGETITETVTNGSNTLTQGFHQTFLSSVALHELDESIVFSAFPNPVLNQLNIEISDAELGSTIQLVDSRGSIILVQELHATSTIVDFSKYSMGTYYLHLVNLSKAVSKTFKIQKTNKS